MRLVESLPEWENFKVYFDNFFTSIFLLIQLKEKGFHALAVWKQIKCLVQSWNLRVTWSAKVEVQWTVAYLKSGDITFVRWQNNNVVYVASTFVGMGNIDKVKRWSKKDKVYIDVDRPEIIKYYNYFMGKWI